MIDPGTAGSFDRMLPPATDGSIGKSISVPDPDVDLAKSTAEVWIRKQLEVRVGSHVGILFRLWPAVCDFHFCNILARILSLYCNVFDAISSWFPTVDEGGSGVHPSHVTHRVPSIRLWQSTRTTTLHPYHNNWKCCRFLYK